MSHSNSSLNCFASCMAKYEHNYILHTPSCKPISPHLTFGTMAHEVLYKVGMLRDDAYATGNMLSDKYYLQAIPSEVLYEDLKTAFNISSWEKYFTKVINQIEKYEFDIRKEFKVNYGTDPIIDRETKLQLTVDDMAQMGYYGLKQPLVGIIDLMLRDDNHAYILDYKFSTKQKTQSDFDMNSQLPLYASMVSKIYNIPLRNIKVGYIDIPKTDFDKPMVLSNGTLSRAKSQNISQEDYKAYVKAVHGDDPKYNCEPGGYYYDCYCNLAFNKAAYINMQYLDSDMCEGVMKDLMNAAKVIDMFIENKLPFLHKYDAYSCANCDYVQACKPWLTVWGNKE